MARTASNGGAAKSGALGKKAPEPKADFDKARLANPASRHPVIFAGAGPGDPHLLTVAAANALYEAHLVVTAGSLVNPAIIKHWTRDAVVLDSAPLSLGEIVDALVKAHFKGLKAVRLHTGDPSIYGAVEEQFQLLAEKGVPVKVIPGVTAAMAAAANLQLELTLPEVTQTLVITRTEGRTPMPPGEELESLCSHRSSLALYLSASHGERVQKALVEAYGPKSHVFVCQRVSWPDELILECLTQDLAKTLKESGVDRHALILAGPAVEAKIGGKPLAAKSKLYDPSFSHGCREASKGPAAAPASKPSRAKNEPAKNAAERPARAEAGARKAGAKPKAGTSKPSLKKPSKPSPSGQGK